MSPFFFTTTGSRCGSCLRLVILGSVVQSILTVVFFATMS
jgi:hypothetical protein